eukprot:gb/GEZN01015495.1/.p1 GENE.gb/GEZN01015495.1/~~gb/GEZN01015495.1/.p1  ORF type:complete len:126 (+),score=4.98 gb/GEZN01015495.1/:383-760(+)
MQLNKKTLKLYFKSPRLAGDHKTPQTKSQSLLRDSWYAEVFAQVVVAVAASTHHALVSLFGKPIIPAISTLSVGRATVRTEWELLIHAYPSGNADLSYRIAQCLSRSLPLLLFAAMPDRYCSNLP